MGNTERTKVMQFSTCTEIAIHLVCDGKSPYARWGDNYEAYAQLQHQLNYELNEGVFKQ